MHTPRDLPDRRRRGGQAAPRPKAVRASTCRRTRHVALPPIGFLIVASSVLEPPVLAELASRTVMLRYPQSSHRPMSRQQSVMWQWPGGQSFNSATRSKPHFS
jgi:hypothetical protein